MPRPTPEDALNAELVGATWGREPAVQRAQLRSRVKLRPMANPNLTPVRQAFVTFGLSIVGWTKPDPRLGRLIAPGDTPARQLLIEDESLCMLGALGEQDAVLAMPKRGPYVNGSAPTLLRERAQGGSMNALKQPNFDNPPVPGDFVWYASGFGGPEHVELLTEALFTQDGAQAACKLVALGEKNDETGAQTCKLMERSWEWSPALDAWRDPATGRSIMYLIDADVMYLLHGLRTG
jgi:hypothetical protein